jgi:hypothetical protein
MNRDITDVDKYSWVLTVALYFSKFHFPTAGTLNYTFDVVHPADLSVQTHFQSHDDATLCAFRGRAIHCKLKNMFLSQERINGKSTEEVV